MVDYYFIGVLIAVCGGVVGMGLLVQNFVINPEHEHIINYLNEIKEKTKAEHDKIILMNCKELGDWLLKDNWYDRDNLIYAQNHYSVECR